MARPSLCFAYELLSRVGVPPRTYTMPLLSPNDHELHQLFLAAHPLQPSSHRELPINRLQLPRLHQPLTGQGVLWLCGSHSIALNVTNRDGLLALPFLACATSDRDCFCQRGADFSGWATGAWRKSLPLKWPVGHETWGVVSLSVFLFVSAMDRGGFACFKAALAFWQPCNTYPLTW